MLLFSDKCLESNKLLAWNCQSGGCWAHICSDCQSIGDDPVEVYAKTLGQVAVGTVVVGVAAIALIAVFERGGVGLGGSSNVFDLPVSGKKKEKTGMLLCKECKEREKKNLKKQRNQKNLPKLKKRWNANKDTYLGLSAESPAMFERIVQELQDFEREASTRPRPRTHAPAPAHAPAHAHAHPHAPTHAHARTQARRQARTHARAQARTYARARVHMRVGRSERAWCAQATCFRLCPRRRVGHGQTGHPHRLQWYAAAVPPECNATTATSTTNYAAWTTICHTSVLMALRNRFIYSNRCHPNNPNRNEKY